MIFRVGLQTLEKMAKTGFRAVQSRGEESTTHARLHQRKKGLSAVEICKRGPSSLKFGDGGTDVRQEEFLSGALWAPYSYLVLDFTHQSVIFMKVITFHLVGQKSTFLSAKNSSITL